MGVLAVEFTGGEPMLNPHWQEYVKIARSFGMQVYIQTNGTMIDDDISRFLLAQEVAGVQISLDSHIKTINDQSRGTPAAFDAAIRGLESLYATDVPLQITLMMHANNVRDVVESVRFFSTKYRRSTVNVDRIVALNSRSQIEPVSAEQYWRALRPYIAMNVRASKVCEPSGKGYGEPSCGVAHSLVYVTAEGEIAACPTMTSRESLELRGPTLSDSCLRDAWYESQFFRGFRYTNCEIAPECTVGKSCGGGCRSNAYSDTSELRAPDEFECNQRKNPTTVWIDYRKLYSKQIFS